MKQSKRQFTFFVSNCASRAKEERGMKYLSRRIWATGTRKRMCAQSTKRRRSKSYLAGRRGKGMFGFRALGFGAEKKECSRVVPVCR